MSTAAQMAAEAKPKEEQTWEQIVPHHYHKWKKVFSETEAKRFPEHQPWDIAIDLTEDAPKMLVTFFAYHTVLTDYHWDCPTFLLSYTPPLCTDYDSSLLPIVTHTSTPTSSIWLVTRTDSLLVLLLVVSVAFQVLVLVVSAWHLIVFKLYHRELGPSV
jgi:hypothetical protein